MTYQTKWQLTDHLEQLDPERIVVYDSEFVRERHYYPKLSLVQIMQPAWQKAQLIDMQSELCRSVWQQLAQQRAPVVIHAASQDLELMHLHGQLLPNMFRDTQIGFSLISPHKAISYLGFVQHYLGIDLDKSETRSDWLARPLTNEQCQYAANDVGLLLQAYPLLCADLQRLNRMHWWQEECQNLLHEQYHHKEPYHWFKLRGAPQKIRKIHQNTAEALVQLRETVAEKYDLPRRKILSDEKIIEIALAQPQKFDDCLALLPAEHYFLAEENIAEHFEQIRTQTPPAQPRAARLNERQRNILTQLMQFTDDVSHALNIHAETLATPNQLRSWILNQEKSALNHGWRQAIFAEFKLR